MHFHSSNEKGSKTLQPGNCNRVEELEGGNIGVGVGVGVGGVGGVEGLHRAMERWCALAEKCRRNQPAWLKLKKVGKKQNNCGIKEQQDKTNQRNGLPTEWCTTTTYVTCILLLGEEYFVRKIFFLAN